MRAFSVRQPWAWAVLYAGKDVENRTRGTSFRGSLALHASTLPAAGDVRDPRTGEPFPPEAMTTRGAVVGVVDVVDSTSGPVDSPWWQGPAAWRLANPRALPEPVPCPGRLSLWKVEPREVRKVNKLLVGMGLAPLPQEPPSAGPRRGIGPLQLRARQDRFLSALARSGNVSAASRLSGVDRTSHYSWFEGDEAYRAKFRAAFEVYLDSMETEADRRALKGVLKPVYQNGSLVGYERRYSDTLLMFRLSAERARKYRRVHEVTGPGGGPVEVLDLSRLSVLELKLLRALRAKLAGLKPAEDEAAALLALGAPRPGGEVVDVSADRVG